MLVTCDKRSNSSQQLREMGMPFEFSVGEANGPLHPELVHVSGDISSLILLLHTLPVVECQ